MRTLLSIACLAVSAFSAPNYQLVWSDEFNYTGLPDPSKWDYDVGGNGWGNRELEYYKRANPKNSYVDNGALKITVNREDTSWTASSGTVTTNHLSSARLVTRGKQVWKYGRFEARMKLPKGRGMWPAFWLIPPNNNAYGNWPTSGEIDVMENYGYEPTVMHATVHTKNNYGGNAFNNWALAEYPVDSFHVYALDWRPDTVTISVDGRPYFQYTNPKTGYASWPFDQPFYMILNVAVNGIWGDTNYTETKYLPQSMIVDYVRVYQDANQGIPAYTVALNQTTGGTISVSPAKTSYGSGERVQISAAPATGYVFSGWGNPATSGSSKQPTDSITVTGNITLAATFTKIPDSVGLTITQSIGGYTCVRPALPKYQVGTNIQIYALPLAGYHFTGWIAGAVGKLATDTMIMAVNTALRASYAKNPDSFTVTLTQNVGGTISTSPALSKYQTGTKIQIIAAASPGYTFSGWTSGAIGKLATDSLTVSANATLAASFTKIPDSASVTLTQTVGGVISVNLSAAKLPAGTKVQIVAKADSGYSFCNWSTGSILATDTLVIDIDRTLSATFQKTPTSPTFSVVQTIGGTVSVSPVKTSYQPGEKIQIQAISEAGYKFVGWISGTSSQLVVDSIKVDSIKTLSALFKTTNELVPNGGFDLGLKGWMRWNDPSMNSTYLLRNGMACVRPGGIGAMGWYTQMTYAGLPIVVSNNYQISFVAKATAKRTFTIFLSQGNSPYGALTIRPVVTVDTVLARQTLILGAGMSDGYGRVEINYAMDSSEICLDSISVKQVANIAGRSQAASQTASVVRATHQEVFVTTDKVASWTLRTLNGNLVQSGIFPQAGTHAIVGVPAMIGILTLDSPDGIRQSIKFSTL